MTDPITTSGSVGTIQYSGLTSDTKWAEVVDDLISIERFNINRLESWKSEWEDKVTVIDQLANQLLILESKAGDLNSLQEFRATTSASSNENVLTVTSNSNATTGAHSVTIGSNIPHMIASQGLTSKTTAVGVIGTQNLVITVGSHTINVSYVATPTATNGEFDSSSTLENIVTAINADAENTNYVTASIIGDGSSSNKYRLVLQANTGGDDNLISVTSNPLNLNFSSTNISNTVETTWAGAAATASGTSAATQNKTYTFTAAGTGTVGQSGSLKINWNDGTGTTGSIEAGSGYTAGTALTVADGIQISLASGSITTGQIFNVNVYNNVEDVVQTDWRSTFAVPEKAGYYTGSTNKTFNFAIFDTGAIGTDEIDLYWIDSEGNSDTVKIPSTYKSGDEIAIYQGLKVKFDTSTYKDVEKNGKFSIKVLHSNLQAGQDTGLAQAEIETHAGFTDRDKSYVSDSQGTFSYTYAGTTRSLTIPKTTTLLGLASTINSDEDNPGITASVINDGSGLSTAYHLQLISNNTGAAYKIENISHTLGNLSGSSSDGYGFTETQVGQNSMIKVDGYPETTGEYMQRNSNTVGDVITGVTMSLLSAGTAAASITIDKSSIKENIQEFVDSLNDVLDYITAMSTHIEEGSEEYTGPMIGNYSFQIVEQSLNSILTSSVSGLTDGTDTYTLLSQIGISTEEDTITIEDYEGVEWTKSKRRWVIDDSDLDEALSTDFDAVANLFIKNDTTSVDGIAELFKEKTDKLTTAYTSENPGILEVLKKHYGDIISNIDIKIAREELRVSMVEARLNTRFAMLEVMLGQLGGQENALTALIDSMDY